jgi:uncharacterized protein YdeI (YjbR/CyaY-like superfamily)
MYNKLMINKAIATGVVHKIPTDLKMALLADHKALAVWEDITPLARNEWICWVTSAKLSETRTRRINVELSKLRSGMRRPCCWAGCIHR